MSRLILLIRHGAHDEVGRVLSGRSDIGLNAEGVRQAERLARWLDAVPIDTLHASPRRRARDTALPLARRRGLPVAEAAAIDEIDFGAFTGRSFATLAQDSDWHAWNAQRDTAQCPGGEGMAAMLDRARTYRDALPAGTSAIVTHCDVIRGLVADVLGVPMRGIFAFDCDPGSITTLADGDGGWRLLSLNERPR